MEHIELLIVGGGAAGIGAALGAWESGCRSLLLVDRGETLGGVLLQCAHRGFGPEQTGMEYAQGLASQLPEELPRSLRTTVLSVSPDRQAVLVSPVRGTYSLRFDRMILASGCMEIPLGALGIAGTRPSGVYTAGQMQAMMNLDGYLPEGPVVILGSGDMGLILANQIADAGIPVTLVEQKPECGGMLRNRKKVAEGGIPLLTDTTITEVGGYPALEYVLLSDGTKLPCRSLLTAVGLRPDRELLRGLESPDWLSLCGNCSQPHAVVESVAAEGKRAGAEACRNRKVSP